MRAQAGDWGREEPFPPHPYTIRPRSPSGHQAPPFPSKEGEAEVPPGDSDLPTPTPMLPQRCRPIPQRPLPRKGPPPQPLHDQCAEDALGGAGERDPKLCSEAKSQTWVPSSPLGPPTCAGPVGTCVHTAAAPSTYPHPHPERLQRGGGRLVKGDPCRMEWHGGQQIQRRQGPWVPGSLGDLEWLFLPRPMHTVQTPGPLAG